MRWNYNGKTEFAEHDAIITEQETIAYRDRTIISMWHEAIIVFRALSVKILPGESRLPALSVQVCGSSQWPRASVVFIAGAPRKSGHLSLESVVTAQNDEFKGSFYSSYSRLLNVKT